ncbi:HAD family hydrolase [Saccharothrix australiensis]|uniref:HAD superfamily hydrolase (TIGR01493 family)/HAD superfamily hydrolase (TIGR01509 family)/HAD superfamily hydrolase (TIGR01549 family) n=1 Tax=Saccharothrix australiensis TaxID=2072 RepID=A0A495VUR5_9PSEU|nr:HAD family hydrolase [Saccharothrix australiensis]RKT52213.1 HAD superfamily hydrolase (TIGR01493 family)/HAD superfamily hydrolase (TIGR01509 family)/HAD superfamily hydrolase (TIGR01549 family) [Saccharothrix australiensis]
MTKIRAVLFDFSGTLFRLEHDSLVEHADLLRALTAPVGVAEGLDIDPVQWERRDLDGDLHRELHLKALTAVGAEDPGDFYDRLCSPPYWQPYPDTAAALGCGLPTAVVSNIAWDVRAVFARHGVEGLVDEFVLSYEVGSVKPDPAVFRVACERLGVEPAEALMVGDSEEADGGAAAIGCRVAIVPPLETAERPDALLRVLREHGVA